jgi:hypothetical protein
VACNSQFVIGFNEKTEAETETSDARENDWIYSFRFAPLYVACGTQGFSEEYKPSSMTRFSTKL